MLTLVVFSYIDLTGNIDISFFPNAEHLTSWIMVIGTLFLLYVITYAKSAKEQTQFIKEQVTISQNQLESQTRPWVYAYLARKIDMPTIIWMVIENVGSSPAKEIQFLPESDRETDNGVISARYEILNRGIDYLGPKKKISSPFADSEQDTEYKKANFVFNLNIKYRDQ